MRNTDITLYSRTTVVLWQQARPYPTKDGMLSNQTRGYAHYLRGHQSPVKILISTLTSPSTASTNWRPSPRELKTLSGTEGLCRAAQMLGTSAAWTCKLWSTEGLCRAAQMLGTSAAWTCKLWSNPVNRNHRHFSMSPHQVNYNQRPHIIWYGY